jgi:hypothetical protein
MRFGERLAQPASGGQDRAGEIGEEALQQALAGFRASVHAWSEAAYARPRTLPAAARFRIWRLALGWSLGCVLLAGAVSGGIVEHRHKVEAARIAAAQAAERQRLATERQAREDEDELLAKVDSDVSQSVPSAMEPLAQLMAEDESR